MTDRITIYKCDHNGVVMLAYSGTVAARAETWICITARFDHETSDLGFISFNRGDLFTEWFYTDRWYNIFRIEDGTNGALKGWYCNITRPAVIDAHSVRADDLALDLFVSPRGSVVMLDEHEFDALNLPPEERIAAVRAVETLREAVARRATPFNEIRTDTGSLRAL